MDKGDRSKRIHFIAQYIPSKLNPVVGVYFGEHVIRVGGQLCAVVNSDGLVGIRALNSELAAELEELCNGQHWMAHGRVYDQWFLLPDHIALNDKRISAWLSDAAIAVYKLSQMNNNNSLTG